EWLEVADVPVGVALRRVTRRPRREKAERQRPDVEARAYVDEPGVDVGACLGAGGAIRSAVATEQPLLLVSELIQNCRLDRERPRGEAGVHAEGVASLQGVRSGTVSRTRASASDGVERRVGLTAGDRADRRRGHDTAAALTSGARRLTDSLEVRVHRFHVQALERRHLEAGDEGPVVVAALRDARERGTTGGAGALTVCARRPPERQREEVALAGEVLVDGDVGEVQLGAG